MQQRFIEHDLPLTEISRESVREKNINHGHPSAMHVWWARRPLASSRTTALAALLDDPGAHEPEKRREIRDLIKEIAPWDAVKNGNSAAINKAQKLIKEQYGDEPPKVLDPFAGGGSIPLEALRLGCETYASDYNPVAVFVEKATLEWPQKFGVEIEVSEDGENDGLGLGGKKVNVLAYLVEKWANRVLEEAREEIGQFYPTETSEDLVGKREITEDEGWIPVGYLWTRTVPCQNPTCDATIPLAGQFWLCKRKGKKIAYRPVVKSGKESIDFELLEGKELQQAIDEGFDPSDGTVNNGHASCPVCGQVTKNKQLRDPAVSGQMGEQLVATILHHPDESGKKYRLAEKRDTVVFQKAAKHLEKVVEEWEGNDSPLPGEKIDPRRPSPNARGLSGLTRYQYNTFADLYNGRQSLFLVTAMEAVKKAIPQIQKDALGVLKNDKQPFPPQYLGQVVHHYLVILISRMVDRLTTFTRWNNRRETMEAALSSDKKVAMLWDFVEANPFSGSGGSWASQLDWVLRFIKKNDWQPVASATAKQESATSLSHEDESIDAILTDPPYYDNYPYADLSDYYYVWLKRMLGDVYPELFATPLTPKSEEAVMLTSRQSSVKEANAFFENQLLGAFREMNRVLKPEGVAVVVYAHKTTEGWETMLRALIESGFVVTGSWPVETEMKNRVQSGKAAFLASSIYMVCRKTRREPLGFWNDIQPQIKQRVEEKLEQFWEADAIKGGDFFISAIGPGMEAYSRYDEVQTYSGEPFNVYDLLQYIRSVATDFLVKRLLRGVSSGAVDKEAQFYLTYRWTFRDGRVEYDDALRIAKAEGVNLDRIAGKDSFIKKTTKYIYVHGPQDRDAVKEVHNMVDAMHLACTMWSSGRKDDIGPFLAKHDYSQNSSFWQFCQAIAECLPEGNKEKQWLEGMLMSKDQYQQAESAGAGDGQKGQIEIEFGDDA
jgi:adenine-specific DNA methylase